MTLYAMGSILARAVIYTVTGARTAVRSDRNNRMTARIINSAAITEFCRIMLILLLLYLNSPCIFAYFRLASLYFSRTKEALSSIFISLKEPYAMDIREFALIEYSRLFSP